MIGWMYILECASGAYYTGSTNNLELWLQQHQHGEGVNFTKKPPIQILIPL
jgi:putative endonuclease